MHAYRDRLGRSYPTTDVLGVGGIQGAGKRQSWLGFAELSLPLGDKWDVSLAGRGADHDDVDATLSYQVASRLRVNEALTLRGAWDRGSKPPSLYSLHFSSSDFPYACDTKTHRGPLATCAVEQVVRDSTGNRDLEPDEAESFSVGAATDLGPLSMSADWFWIELSDTPASLSTQSIVNLEVSGALPPGADVIRTPGGQIDRIVSPLYNSGETETSGADVRARLGWDAGWADLVLDTRWLHVTRLESRVAGERQPGDHARDRVNGTLRASRGGLTANWNVHAVSSFWNGRRTGRFDEWVGHDITLRWKNPLGLDGLDLIGGVLNVADRNPSVDPTNPDAVFAPADSIRGRTFFLNTTMSW